MHDFHLTISRLLFLFLEPIANRLDMTVNHLIRVFIYIAIDHIDLLFQDYGRQPNSTYEKVNVGGTRHIHIYITRGTYERLKWLHGHYNNYSIAQIIRRCVFFMLKMLQEYRTLDAVMEEIRRLERVTREFTDSCDNRGFMENLPRIRQLLGDERVTYEVIALFIESFADWLDSPMQIA